MSAGFTTRMTFIVEIRPTLITSLRPRINPNSAFIVQTFEDWQGRRKELGQQCMPGTPGDEDASNVFRHMQLGN